MMRAWKMLLRISSCLLMRKINFGGGCLLFFSLFGINLEQKIICSVE